MIKQIIVVRKDLLEKMNCGKLAAQVAHASTLVLLKKMRGFSQENVTKNNESYRLYLDIDNGSDIKEWIEGDFKKIILTVKNEKELLKLHKKLSDNQIVSELVKDKAYNIFDTETITCLGIEPLKEEIIDTYTKRLQTL